MQLTFIVRHVFVEKNSMQGVADKCRKCSKIHMFEVKKKNNMQMSNYVPDI